MASKKNPQGTSKTQTQPQWAQIVEGFLSAVASAFTGSVRVQAEEIAEDVQKRMTRHATVAFLGILGLVYVTIALVHLLSVYFSLAAPWSYLVMGLLLIVAALAYSKR